MLSESSLCLWLRMRSLCVPGSLRKQNREFVWGALRCGVIGNDWAQTFVHELAAFNFPGFDYLITSPRTDLLGFTKTPARWGDAERGIHAALVEAGVPFDEAITYTLHSFKHLFVTAGRQLGLAEPSIDVMAAWAMESSSGMPAVYDSEAGSSELLYKYVVHSNVRQVWFVLAEGSIPEAPTCEAWWWGCRRSDNQRELEAPSEGYRAAA